MVLLLNIEVKKSHCLCAFASVLIQGSQAGDGLQAAAASSVPALLGACCSKRWDRRGSLPEQCTAASGTRKRAVFSSVKV